MYLQPFPVCLEPLPHVLILMVRSIVLNQMDLVFSGLATRGCYLFQETQIRFGIKDKFAAVIEPGILKINRAENFHALPSTRHWDQRLGSDAGPGLVEGRVLAEASLVFEEDVGFFVPRFFLMFGYV